MNDHARNAVAPDELRPALRDPTARQALSRVYRDLACVPVSQRYAPPPEPEPEPIPLDEPGWREPASVKDAEDRLQWLTTKLARIEEQLEREKRQHPPNSARLRHLGREKVKLTPQLKPLRRWLYEQRRAARHRAHDEKMTRRADWFGGEVTAETLLVHLYILLDQRIRDDNGFVWDAEKMALAATRDHLREAGRDPLDELSRMAIDSAGPVEGA